MMVVAVVVALVTVVQWLTSQFSAVGISVPAVADFPGSINAVGISVISKETNKPLLYNKENLLNPWFVVSK